MEAAGWDGRFEGLLQGGDGLGEDGRDLRVKVPDCAVVEEEAGEADAAFDGRVAFGGAGVRVAVCVEGVFDVEDFGVEVVLGFFVEVLVGRVAFDPLGPPGEFAEVVDCLGEGGAEDARYLC